MALNPEEYKQRRIQRQQERQVKQAQQKRLLIRLGIAGAVLIACAVLIIVVVCAGSGKAPEQTTPTLPAASQTTVPSEGTSGSEPEGTASSESVKADKKAPTVIHLGYGEVRGGYGEVRGYAGSHPDQSVIEINNFAVIANRRTRWFGNDSIFLVG